MIKMIRSSLAKVITFIGGYIAAFSVARDVNRAFNYYAERSLGGWMKMGIAISFFLFIICLGLFCASVWLSKNSGSSRIWRKFDFSVMIVFTLGAVFLCAYYLLNRPAYILLLFYSAIAYAAVMALIAETLTRLRDKTLRSTLYWPRFFKIYPFGNR